MSNLKKCPKVEDFPNICRTCLKIIVEKTDRFSLFYKGDGKKVSDMLRAFIRKVPGPKYPNQICAACLKDLTFTFNFMEKCRRSYSTLNWATRQQLPPSIYFGCVKEVSSELMESMRDVINVTTFECDEPEPIQTDYRVVAIDRPVLNERNMKKPTGNHESSLDNEENTESVLESSHIDIKTEDEKKNCIKTVDVAIQVEIEEESAQENESDDVNESEKIEQTKEEDYEESNDLKDSCYPDLLTIIDGSNYPVKAESKNKRERKFNCDKRTAKFSCLKRHKMIHLGQRLYLCEICEKGFTLRIALKRHKRIHLRKKPVGCHNCERFSRYNKFHSKKCSQDDTKMDNLLHKSSVSENRNPNNTEGKNQVEPHNETQSILCNVCGKGFNREMNLKLHLRVHSGEKPYTCEHCGKSFTQQSSLSTHKLIHDGTKPHSCPKCGKSFTQKTHLMYHLRVHDGIRPFTCKLCDKKFSFKSNLTVHIRTHTGETPYKCPVCNKGFHDSSGMKKHCKTHKVESKSNIEHN